MMRILDTIFRFIVGGLFIFSGLIKLNDPVGTQIKLEEYFDVFASDFGSFFELFIPMALPIGLVLIVLEIVLGVAVLIHYNMKKTTWILLMMILFFSFLTFYSAYFNKVTDCGCFGDAITLTPWESFTKDIVLLVMIAHLFWYRKKYDPMLRKREGQTIIIATTVVSIYLGVFAIRHLPFIDFRPYKVGDSIPKNMLQPEPTIVEYEFEKDGKKVMSPTVLSASEGYKYIASRVVNSEASTPKITDYNVVSPEGEDVTDLTFSGVKLMVIMYDANKASVKKMEAIRELVNDLEGKIEVMFITASTADVFEPFRHEHQLAAPYYYSDATVIKAMIRSNPGVMLLNEGTVLGKWHFNDTPTVNDIVDLL